MYAIRVVSIIYFIRTIIGKASTDDTGPRETPKRTIAIILILILRTRSSRPRQDIHFNFI